MSGDDDLHGAAGVSIRQLIGAGDEDEPAVRYHAITAGEQPELGGPDGWHFEIPRQVAPYLKADEEKIIPVRFHMARLILPALAAGGGLAVAAGLNSWLYETGQAPPGLVHVIWLAWLAGLGWALYRWIEWRQTWFVITGHRLVLIESRRMLGRRVTMLPIAKMRDVKLEITPVGRLAGYGTLDFASIGTEGALDRVGFLPHPEWLYQEICDLAMPEETRKVVKRQRNAPR